MSSLRQIIKEHLLLEKRIAQLMSSFEVNYGFEVDRTSHAHYRKTRTGIIDYNEKEISNGEIKYVIELALKQIAEGIALHNIIDDEPFVIKSVDKEIALAVSPKHVDGSFWRLVILTVFRESYNNPFKVGKNQLVIWV